MRISATIGYLARLTASGVAGVYVAAYGFPLVIVVAVIAMVLSMLGLDLFGPHRVVVLVVFIFAAMTAIHYGWTVPIPYYVAR